MPPMALRFALISALTNLPGVQPHCPAERLIFDEDSSQTSFDNLPEVMEFEEYIRIFGKVYSSDEQVTRRKAAFEENVRIINEYNSNQTSFRLGVNVFADLTREEFAAKYTARMPPPQSPHNTVFLPEANGTIDWRTKGAVTPIKNQAHCGSCWAFSTTGAVEGAFFLATGELRNASEQQLADCSGKFGNHGCSGGLMDNGFKYIINNSGIDSDEDYSYKSFNGTDFQCWSSAESRHILTIDNYSDVPRANESQLAAAVLSQPVSVALEADQSVFHLYKSGVMDEGAACGTKLDHGVLVVGLTSDAYVVKNSWGPTWGEAGYIRLKRNWNSSSTVGICGIATQPSYPIKAKGKAPPVPPFTPNGSRPGPVPVCPGCNAHDIQMCGAFGMHCCCHNASSTRNDNHPMVTCHASAECCCKGQCGPTTKTLL